MADHPGLLLEHDDISALQCFHLDSVTSKPRKQSPTTFLKALLKSSYIASAALSLPITLDGKEQWMQHTLTR